MGTKTGMADVQGNSSISSAWAWKMAAEELISKKMGRDERRGEGDIRTGMKLLITLRWRCFRSTLCYEAGLLASYDLLYDRRYSILTTSPATMVLCDYEGSQGFFWRRHFHGISCTRGGGDSTSYNKCREIGWSG